tara:strand:+ start:3027 stop:3209 length:183 start_codon:yes stop_codon:yes gene_type:complete
MEMKMNWLKDILKKWKVHITVVGGVVVVATVYGTCNYELPVVVGIDDAAETDLVEPVKSE